MAQTIRELIEKIALEVRNIDAIGADGAAQKLVELTSLLASINKHCADTRYWLGLKKIQLLEEHKTASKANIHAEGSEEFKQWLEAEEYRKATIEMIRGIKYFLRNLETEKREARY